jgi:hypothetical protein
MSLRLLKKIVLIAGTSITLGSCGYKYTHVDIYPTKNENGWIKNLGEYTYNCYGNKVSVTGVSSYEYRQKTFFYIDVGDEYSTKTAQLTFTSDTAITIHNRCSTDLLQLTSDGKVFKPADFITSRILGEISCLYTFRHDVINYESFILSFNPGHIDCNLPSLQLKRNIEYGYRNVPLQ